MIDHINVIQDYKDLKDYEQIETFYDDIKDYTKLLNDIIVDRIEALKYIVRINKELEQLHSIIKEAREYIRQCIRIIHNERTGTFENDVYMKEQHLKEFLEILDKENKE